MPRSVRTFLPVSGDPAGVTAAFVAEPMRWLPSATRRSGDAYVTTVRAGALARPVAIRVGRSWTAGSTRWRSFDWDPIGQEAANGALGRLLPAFDGELGLHVYGRTRVTLLLDGRYAPPGGAVGLALDSAGLHRVAQTTAEWLLEHVAARLSAEAMRLDGSPRPAAAS